MSAKARGAEGGASGKARGAEGGASGPGDAAFFLQAARLNLAKGDHDAALVCLESVASRKPTDAERATVLELAAKLETSAKDERARERARALKKDAPRADAPRAEAPRPESRAAPKPSPVATDSSIDLVRRLLISPELVDRLRTALAPRAPATTSEGPLALPAAEVVTRLLSVELDVQAIADLALDLVVKASGAERGFLILSDEAGRCFAAKGTDGRPPEASLGILREVERTRATVIVDDASQDQRFRDRESVVELNVRSVLCVPIVPDGAERPLGVIYLDARSTPRKFGPREQELAQSLAAAIAPALGNAQRFEEQALELARTKRAFAEVKRGFADDSSGLVGESPAMRELKRLIERVAPGNHTVLIEGESGTGKELVARALHQKSERARGPFVAENMAALAGGVLEAELFGHAKGAFTGADRARAGIFQLAERGTLFLDEIAEVGEDVQRKLLRVLQEREVRPIGGGSSVKIDVRVVAATNRDLGALVRDGEFREDLFYRLSVVRIVVPPLRKRLDDLPLLLEHFVARAAAHQKRPRPTIAPELLARLARHRWPGNVRELEAFATRLLLEGPSAEIAAVPGTDQGVSAASEGSLDVEVKLADMILPLRDARGVFDRAYVALVLKRHGGNVTAAAKALDLNRTYLSEIVKRYGLRES